jgi:nicotinate-nucleotide adenylyltransferase
MTNLDLDRDRPQRIGLFGGTFNPIHRGHIQAAKEVLEQFQIQRIFFIPSALPPHKKSSNLAAAEDRLAMVRLALGGEKGLEACDLELQRGGHSYTYDTLRYFREHTPRGSQIFFLVGIDAFCEIDTWKNSPSLFDEAAFIILSRPPNNLNRPETRNEIHGYIQRNIAAGYRFDGENNSFSHGHKQSIFLCSVTPVAISSTQIRAALVAGDSIAQWVAPIVAEFIARKGLYR